MIKIGPGETVLETFRLGLVINPVRFDTSVLKAFVTTFLLEHSSGREVRRHVIRGSRNTPIMAIADVGDDVRYAV